MRFKKVLPLVIVSALLIFAVWVLAQEGEETSPEQQKMMELMMKYGTPGDHHKELASFVGNWDITTKFWSMPDAEAQISIAEATVEWIMGGRYTMEKVTSEIDGMPFEGMGIVGYDNYGEKFNSFWIDNLSTMFLVHHGTGNDDGTMYTMEGTYDDYITGTKNKPTKIVTTVVDNDHRVTQYYDYTADGTEYISMELSYARK